MRNYGDQNELLTRTMKAFIESEDRELFCQQDRNQKTQIGKKFSRNKDGVVTRGVPMNGALQKIGTAVTATTDLVYFASSTISQSPWTATHYDTKQKNYY